MKKFLDMLFLLKYWNGLSDFTSTTIKNLKYGYDTIPPYPENIYVYINNYSTNFQLRTVDFVVPLILGLFLILCRKLFTKYISHPLSDYYKINILKRHKFYECFFKIFITLTSSIFALHGYYNIPELGSYDECFKIPDDIIISNSVWSFYMYQLSTYVYGLYSILFIDCGRTDSLLLAFHHFVATFLLYYSLGTKYVYAGIITLVCHVFNDVLLDSSKTLVYIRSGKKSNKLFWDIVLGLMLMSVAVSWILTRIILYFDRLIFPIIYYMPKVSDVKDRPFSGTFFFLLFSLLCMNIYWSILIFRTIAYSLIVGQVEDIREVQPQSKDKKKKKN